MLEEFADLANNAPEIKADANYWFIRTNGGELYEPFRGTGSIAIGYPEVTLDFIESLDDSEESRDSLKEKIRIHHPPVTNEDGNTHDNSGLAASQLLKFCNEIRRGDIVIIPSDRTERLAIGFVEDDAPFEEPLVWRGMTYSNFKKRRKVSWKRGVDKSDMNPNLFKLLLNRMTLVQANDYSEWIDPMLYEFFNKGGDFHYVMKIRSRDHIRANTLFRACIDLMDLVSDFAAHEEVNASVDEIETRINLNSPGDVELWHRGVEAIGLLALMVIAINGGGFTLELKKWDFKMSLKTEGLLKRLTEFLNHAKNRQTVDVVRKKLESLQVQSPEQVIALLKETKQK